MDNLKPVVFSVGNKTVLLHYLVVVGSKLHNLENENSDTDLKGVFTWSFKDLTSLQGNSLLENLEKTNVTEEDFLSLKEQVNQKFNLNLSSEDDFVLMESRKFVLNCTKSDLNLLDMLYANQEFVVFETKDFNQLRMNGQKTLVNFDSAKSRFKGLADNTFKRYLNKPSLFKDLSRAFHALFVIKNLLKTCEYNSKLYGEDRDFVLSLKNNTHNFSLNELVSKFNELMNEVIEMETPVNDSFDLNSSNKFLTPLFVM